MAAAGLGSWGSNELQSYQAVNATVTNGLLTITARTGRVGAKKHTSARPRALNRGGQWQDGTLGGTVEVTALQQAVRIDDVRVYAPRQSRLTGPRIVEPNASASYPLSNPTGPRASYSWTSPTGQTSGASILTVNRATTGGPGTVDVTDGCGDPAAARRADAC